jgi:hypothetical protein
MKTLSWISAAEKLVPNAAIDTLEIAASGYPVTFKPWDERCSIGVALVSTSNDPENGAGKPGPSPDVKLPTRLT